MLALALFPCLLYKLLYIYLTYENITRFYAYPDKKVCQITPAFCILLHASLNDHKKRFIRRITRISCCQVPLHLKIKNNHHHQCVHRFSDKKLRLELNNTEQLSTSRILVEKSFFCCKEPNHTPLHVYMYGLVLKQRHESCH